MSSDSFLFAVESYVGQNLYRPLEDYVAKCIFLVFESGHLDPEIL